MLTPGFFDRSAEEVARDLVGTYFRVGQAGGRIVETEAYDAFDPASHSFVGPTQRNAPMFGPAGRAYVYRIYGLHWCFNVVCDAAQPGSAVLIRAIEPLWGLAEMRGRRGVEPVEALCSGPGKLCQALGIDAKLNGCELNRDPFWFSPSDEPVARLVGERIGLTRGLETPWRFGLARSRFLSRPFAGTAAA
jgi:DNA-3-methyladenine glycosylase